MTEEKNNSEEQTDTTTGEEEDEGLQIQIGIENGNVIIMFDKRIASFTLPPESAEKMGKALTQHAKTAREMGET